LGFLFLAQICIVVEGWGQEGHKSVVQIGYNLLTDKTKNAVYQMLGSNFSLPGIVMGPDGYRYLPQGAWSYNNHFINVPRGAISLIMKLDCPNYCVARAVQNYTSILTDQQYKAEKMNEPLPLCNFVSTVEPCALEFYSHFVGDIHQPLHVGYIDDLGGNRVNVSFFGIYHNLHSIWDTYILTKWNPDWESIVTSLEDMYNQNLNGIRDEVNLAVESMDPVTWAEESYDIVKSVIYNFPDGYLNGTTIPIIGDLYMATALPIVQKRILMAAYRMSKTWNNIYDPEGLKKLDDLENNKNWVMIILIVLVVVVVLIVVATVISFGLALYKLKHQYY